MELRLDRACLGKTENSNGMNIPELKKLVEKIKEYHGETHKMNRKELLQILCKDYKGKLML